MGRDRTKQAAYQRKYMNRHRMLCVLLDEKDDADIIFWLGKQENRSEAVREVLRKEAWHV